MLKKLKVLATAFRLGSFTISELSTAADVSEMTVRTVLQRAPTEWFDTSTTSSGTKGGQPHCYKITEAGLLAIREQMSKLPSVDALTPEQPPEEVPLGLQVARETLEALPTARRALIERLREDALRNLDWAQAELEGGAFLTGSGSIRLQISELRAQLQTFPVPEGGAEAGTAPSAESGTNVGAAGRDRWDSWIRTARERLEALASNVRAHLNRSSNRQADGGHQVQIVISYLEADASAREMASIANGAVNFAIRRQRKWGQGFEISVRNVAANDLLKVLRVSRDTDPTSQCEILFCAAEGTDSRDLARVLKGVDAISRTTARVLDSGYNAQVADVTKRLRFHYDPHAAEAERMDWVDETILERNADNRVRPAPV